MKSPIVILTALESELNSQSLGQGIPVLYSGIGKVNAAIATFRAIQRYEPQLILNFGTVGRINAAVSGLVQVSKVIQRDMIAEPLAPRGTVPFSSKPNEYYSGDEGSVCGTGDSFVIEQDEWLLRNQVDVVDMELFAIASVAHEHGIAWKSFKFISDDANEDSVHEWQKKVNHGEALFLKKLEVLKKLVSGF